MSTQIALLDRDGVIDRDSPDFVKTWSEFEFLPGSLDALVRLAEAGVDVMIVTNQSAVGRGLITVGSLMELHARMVLAVEAAGGVVRDIFFCPHLPQGGCSCRKPQPGLIQQAQAKYGFDPQHAVMVGDSAKDILCGRNAACGRTALVATGNGSQAREDLERRGIRPNFFGADLAAVTDWILEYDPQGFTPRDPAFATPRSKRKRSE